MKYFCLLLSGVWMSAEAQQSADTSQVKKLDEVVISANRHEEKKKEIPYVVESINIGQIEFNNAQSTGDMLLNTGSVFVQKSQMGGGSPVLRGFEASRVLIVIDGVRMNNAIYRSGHLQDVITLDQSMFDRTEVVFGPSSVMYGSDALGGVMCFYTKRALFGDDSGLYHNTHSYFRWSSANNEFTGHADINLGWKKFASITSFSHSSFGDLRAGSNRDPVYDQYWFRNNYVDTMNGTDTILRNPDRNIQRYSGYSQYDIFQKFSWKIGENVLQSLNLQYSNSSDIPRYDRLTDTSANGDLRFAEWYYGPQVRMMGIFNTRILTANRLFHTANLSLAAQKIRQDRVSRRYKNNIQNHQEEEVMAYSLNADLVKHFDERNELSYGLEGTFNEVRSTAFNRNTLSKNDSVAATRYPDGGSTMSSLAAYLSYKHKFAQDKLIGTVGLRYSLGMVTALFNDTTFYPFPYTSINQRNSALTWSAALIFNPNENWKFSLVNSSGFRTPNVDDLAKVFNSSPGMLIVPNPDLGPEKVINTEFSVEKWFGNKAKTLIAAWYSRLYDAIVMKNYTFEGKDSLVYDGQMSRVQAAQNADEGYVRGVSATVQFFFDEIFSLKSTATYTYGRYYDNGNDTIVPLDHIPPAFGQTSLHLKTKKTEAEFCIRYNGWKHIRDYSPSGEDNLQYATPYGMPSWITLNIKAAFRLNKHIEVNTGIENILDEHYRVFASGISAAGRNFYITLRGKI